MEKNHTSRRRPTPVRWPPLEEIVEVWNSASSPAEAAARLGVTLKSANLRLSYLRKCGVELKKFAPGPKRQPKPEQKPKREPKPVPDPPPQSPRGSAKFAAVWNGASSVREAAERFGISIKTACVRARQLRCLGVRLKKFSRGRPPKPKTHEKHKSRRPRRSVSEFASIWNAAATTTEAAEQMGLTPRSAATIAAAYRREGIALKLFNSGFKLENAPEFTAGWHASTTIEEAALRLKMSVLRARRHAELYRRNGVALKELPTLDSLRRTKHTERFVAVWNAAGSPGAAAAALGMNQHAATNLATRLRKQGIQLKLFPPGRR